MKNFMNELFKAVEIELIPNDENQSRYPIIIKFNFDANDGLSYDEAHREVDKFLDENKIDRTLYVMKSTLLNNRINHNMNTNPVIEVKYHNKDMTKLEINNIGNFVDMRAAETVELKAGDFKLIDLGVSIKLPDGYWGQVVPRSSLFKNHGVIQTNSFGVIDTSYCGEDDHWKLPVYATRDTTIEFDERICQFRIVKDNDFTIEEVEYMKDASRGGFGSTGKV